MSKYKQLSNAIQIAAATGNVEALYAIESDLDDALTDGDISVIDRAALGGELEAETDALQRNDYLDEGYAAIAQGL